VIRLRAIVSLLLVALWLPASSHALLEHLELIHQVHADHDADSPDSHEHDADNHEAADGVCALTSTHVSVPLPDSVAMPSLFCAPGLNWASELHAEQHPSGLAPPGTAPPMLPSGWQFLFRTALPCRAPSFAA
jgi:hypothetical protein